MAVCRRSSSDFAAPLELFPAAGDRFWVTFLAVFLRPVFLRTARLLSAFFFGEWLRADFSRVALFRVVFFLALGFLMGVATPSASLNVFAAWFYSKAILQGAAS